MMSSIETKVEIQENERKWMGGGFSKKGLLPNDYGKYTTSDGSMSWKSLKEAGDDLLEKGWTYAEDEFSPAKILSDGTLAAVGDDDGWYYARDFTKSALQSSTNKKSMMHWVRYRTLVRTKVFDPTKILSADVYSKCEHCDSKVIEQISKYLLEILSFSTLLYCDCNSHGPSTNSVNTNILTISIVSRLKSKLIDTLNIGGDGDDYNGEDAKTADGALVKNKHQRRLEVLSEENMFNRLTALYRILEDFIEEERKDVKKGLFTSSSKIITNNIPFSKRNDDIQVPGFNNRCLEISTKYFNKNERNLLSGLIIRDLDTKFEIHCNKENCGSTCKFAYVPCPNYGCDYTMSKLHLDEHDGECDYKVISCPLKCNDEFPRHRLDVHLKEICPERVTKCTFSNIGCTSEMKAKDLPQHIIDDTNSHLLLAVNRMMEYQGVICKLNNRVKSLEEENNTLKQIIEVNKVTLVKEITGLSQKLNSLNRKVTDLDHATKKEFKRILK